MFESFGVGRVAIGGRLVGRLYANGVVGVRGVLGVRNGEGVFGVLGDKLTNSSACCLSSRG